MPTVGVLLLTLNGEKHLPHLLPPLLNSSLKPKILAIDSSSTDKTVLCLKESGINVEVIPKSTFNHGLTREFGRKRLNTDILICLTQDAYLQDSRDLEKLIEPLIAQNASLSYARQIPRKEASLLEAFPRQFNYPETSHIRGLRDIPTWGSYIFFTSNSASAWLNSALDEIGGFKEVLLGEDTLACALLLHRGHKVAYVAEAIVEHSHNFTLIEEFKRNYAIGRSRKAMEFLLQPAGKDIHRGKQFAFNLLKKTSKQPWKLPYTLLHLAAKYAGYTLGMR